MTGPDTRAARLRELALLFLRLGATAFGGPAAHVAMMEDEVVRRRRWLSREELLDLLGAANLIPGPNSTELAIHVGHRRAGFPGLLVAGACFIMPAAVIVTALAWAYVRFGALPEAGGILRGVKPVVLAVVIQALWGFGRAAALPAGGVLPALGLGAAGGPGAWPPLASLALMAVVTAQLARAAIVDLPTALVAAASGVLLLFRVSSSWLVLGGAAAGLLL